MPCNGRGDRRWELVWVSWRIEGQQLLHLRFRWRMRGWGVFISSKTMSFWCQKHQNDIVLILKKKLIEPSGLNGTGWFVDLILIQPIFGPIDQTGLEPWLDGDWTDRSGPILKPWLKVQCFTIWPIIIIII